MTFFAAWSGVVSISSYLICRTKDTDLVFENSWSVESDPDPVFFRRAGS